MENQLKIYIFIAYKLNADSLNVLENVCKDLH